MATLSEIQNNIQTIENISEEVFKYEMEISHLHENSEYYIIYYKKIYTSKGYNYILKNFDGNYYWATPGIKNFIDSLHQPIEIEIKTYEYHKLIDKQGNTYLNENNKPILELEADFKEANDVTKFYNEHTKQIYSCAGPNIQNKVVDDYYISRYIYGLKYSLDTKTETEKIKSTIPLTDIRNKIYDIKNTLTELTKSTNEIKEKSKIIKDILTESTNDVKEDKEEPTDSKSLEVPSPEEINEINKICEYVNNLKFDVFLIYVGKSNEENENRIKELLKTNKEKLKKFIDKYKQATKGCSGNNKNIDCVYKAGFCLAKIETLIEYVGNDK